MAATTELHVPIVEAQRKDSQSCTSVPVITIKRSSESRSIPTSTTIVLQPSLVNSSAAQHSRPGLVNPLAEPRFSLQSTPHKNGAHESAKLHVLKSKNGCSNGFQHTALSKSSPHTDAAANQPSHIVREVSNGQRPEPSVDNRLDTNTSGGSVLSAEPMRADSPPVRNAARSTGSAGTTRTGASSQAQSEAKPQVQASPFEAAEAQSHSRESLESRQSNSDSDKSCESAGQLP